MEPMLLLRTEALPDDPARWEYQLKLDGRNGFTPATRARLFKQFKDLETEECPFANLPEKKSGRWGAGLTARKMVDCRWLKPVLVGQFEFLEWTGENHLRHTKFGELREDSHSARHVDGRPGTREPTARTWFINTLWPPPQNLWVADPHCV
jgi:ATP-dependent DNA ligase